MRDTAPPSNAFNQLSQCNYVTFTFASTSLSKSLNESTGSPYGRNDNNKPLTPEQEDERHRAAIRKALLEACDFAIPGRSVGDLPRQAARLADFVDSDKVGIMSHSVVVIAVVPTSMCCGVCLW